MSVKSLPNTLEERVELALKVITAPQKRRLLCYILVNPNAFTHEIAKACAVGYPPNRLMELNREVLPAYGLHVYCHRPKEWLKNRWGETSQVHQWKLILVSGKEVAV